MKYSCDVKPKHQKKMDMDTKLMSEVKIATYPFPENASRESLNELQWLLSFNKGFIDREFVERGDDIKKVFQEYCEEHNLCYEKDYYEKILKESSKTILTLKNHYNRPRPYQLAEYYGIPDFKIHKLDSANTPSYPSGHTTQGHLMAELLGKKYPNHYNKLKEVANFISKSRLMARAHYISDCVFGQKVAKYIFNSILPEENPTK